MDIVAKYVPMAEGSEWTYLRNLAKCVSEDEFEHFIRLYLPNRKEKNTVLILCVLGFLGLAGIHRFYLGNIRIGVLYIISAGLLYLGTIYDLLKYREMVSDVNVSLARGYARYIDVKLDTWGNPILP